MEEFDPTNLSVASGPWAYVADLVVRVDTSVSIVEEMLRYEALDVVADPGLTLLVYHAEPGSPSAAALARLTP